jgi:hypothetical protein
MQLIAHLMSGDILRTFSKMYIAVENICTDNEAMVP